MITFDDKRARVDIKNYKLKVTDAVRDAVNETAINIEAKAKKNVTKHGELTRPDGKKRKLLVDTGLMRASIHIGFSENLSDLKVFADGDNRSSADGVAGSRLAQASAGLKTAASVAVGVHYAKYHELGIGVKKRPFLLPATESERAAHRRRIKEALKK
jgi:hypothetical protein